ncbi:MAG: NAD(P)H-dependent oxidoreductase [Geminicoccaceae bacterium]|nr:NAD(P)H-dependent oxidoreductase [Geminicoccaceae bacterium]
MAVIALLLGHPAPGGSFCQALCKAYADGARLAGHECTAIEIASLGGDPVLRDPRRYHAGHVPDPLRPAQQALGHADHLVLIYPLWLGGMPALMKGFLEQILTPGFAHRTDSRGKGRKGLKGKSARIIVTMGMPAFVFRWYFGAHSVKSLRRSVLGFCGVGPIRTTLLGGIETVSDARRRRWLEQVRGYGRQAL